MLLSARGTPFVTISGYARGQLPAAYAGTPLVSKPIQQDILVSDLKRCIGIDKRQPIVSVESDMSADLLPPAASATSSAPPDIPG